ncbi:MAG: glutathione S-transferase N-terminal domain-containing protein [Proteobacteria bacterium]|nr:glutathione S-transferase N-terminal domain-containing protein [Pseudomonadota bacterium]MDA1058379.1 glutathione S-transferase N-terminal domain-containing protein [Pseudomonadota bacterium]
MIDLYTVKTANGQRASIVLEEAGLAYDVHMLDLTKGAHQAPAFLKINPLGMGPAITDRDGPDGKPIHVFETLAICTYIAEKTGKFLPAAGVARVEAQKWATMVAADLGPSFAGVFYMGISPPEPVPYGVDLFQGRAKRFLKAMDDRLAQNEFLAGSVYTIADILAYPSATTSAPRVPGGIDDFANIQRWVSTVGARPAVKKGMAASA